MPLSPVDKESGLQTLIRVTIALCSIMKRVGSHDAFRVVRGHSRQVVRLPGIPYVKL
jgi:hypothetical protein